MTGKKVVVKDFESNDTPSIGQERFGVGSFEAVSHIVLPLVRKLYVGAEEAISLFCKRLRRELWKESGSEIWNNSR